MPTKYKIHSKVTLRKPSYKIPHGVSKQETEVLNMIALEFPGTRIFRSDRTVLHGREIDIYLPDRKIGIEFDGNFWHNSDSKSTTYHLAKTIGCEKQGIRLIHIFSDEWELKKPLVIDHIRKSLGKYNEIDSSLCDLKVLSRSEGKAFLDSCELLGDDAEAESYIGILYNNDLVAVMSYVKRDGFTEILRYSERRQIKVKNGISRCCDMIDGDISVSVDRRLYEGWDYVDAGFRKREATNPKAWYTKDYKHRFPSKAFRITEKQAREAGYVSIYDCGDIVYERKATQD